MIENNFTSTNIQHSVIGIGLNVNQDNFSDFERTAISLKLLTNSLHSRDEILEKLCINIEKWYLKLKEGKTELIDKCYHDHLYEINKITVFVDVNHHKFNGRIKSVTKAGKLLLELENDLLKEFDIKEVKFLS